MSDLPVSVLDSKIVLLHVIMAGAFGTRLWPLSRESYPKRLLALDSERTIFQEIIARFVGLAQRVRQTLVLHLYNGSAMKCSTFQACMQSLGVELNYSRPRVSNDNTFAESLFSRALYSGTASRIGTVGYGS